MHEKEAGVVCLYFYFVVFSTSFTKRISTSNSSLHSIRNFCPHNPRHNERTNVKCIWLNNAKLECVDSNDEWKMKKKKHSEKDRTMKSGTFTHRSGDIKNIITNAIRKKGNLKKIEKMHIRGFGIEQ